MESLTEVYSLRQVIHHDHMLIIVAARNGSLSYQRAFARLPKLLQDHFNDCSLMLIYPDQFGESNTETTFTEPHGTTSFEMSKTSAWLSKWLSKI